MNEKTAKKRRERRNAYMREWYHVNRERVRKIRIESDKRYRQKNRERIKRNQQNYKEYRLKRHWEIKDWLRANVEALVCLDCGISFKGRPWLADFHHIDKKSRKSPYNITSYNTLIKELNKGAFLCPTCHRIRHRTKQLKSG